MPRAPKPSKDRKTVWVSEMVAGKIKRVRKSVLISELPSAPGSGPEPAAEPELEPELEPEPEPEPEPQREPAKPQEADVPDVQQDLSGTTEELARLTNTVPPIERHAYVVFCRPFWDRWAERPRRDENAAEDDGEPSCSEPNCICGKFLTDYPTHPWTAMSGARIRVYDDEDEADLRNPENFRMYMHNDFFCYGLLEVTENLVNDFHKAKSTEDKWLVMTALAYWLNTDMAYGQTGIDDGERSSDFMLLVGRGFLSMLNTLDRGDLLKPASKIKDISLVMALYLRVFQLFRDSYFELEDAMWAMHVISYADKHGIKISGPHNTEKHIEAIKSLCADAVDDNGRAVGFPRAGVDRWRWKKQFTEYAKEYGTGRKIGGDLRDITKLTSAQRRDNNFDGVDPLPEYLRDAARRGEKLCFE